MQPVLTPAEKWLVIAGLWLLVIGEFGLLFFLIRRQAKAIRREWRALMEEIRRR